MRRARILIVEDEAIPVIFSTSCLDEKRILQAKIILPFGFLLKPVHKTSLKAMIEKVLSSISPPIKHTQIAPL
jgi:hypothetical protein